MKRREKLKALIMIMPVLTAFTAISMLNYVAYGCLKRAGMRA